MANRNNVHRDNGWGTLREGGQRATNVFDTQVPGNSIRSTQGPPRAIPAPEGQQMIKLVLTCRRLPMNTLRTGLTSAGSSGIFPGRYRGGS